VTNPVTKTGEREAWIASHSLWPHTLQGDTLSMSAKH
jgi:hypothetical protein